MRGGADKSYGVQVARLAGVPESVLQRAKELAEQLSDADMTAAVKDLTSGKKKRTGTVRYDTMELQQMSLFDTKDDTKIIEEIRELEISALTPLEALNILNHLQSEVKNRW